MSMPHGLHGWPEDGQNTRGLPVYSCHQTYRQSQVVRGSDGNYYQALVEWPTSDPTAKIAADWGQIYLEGWQLPTLPNDATKYLDGTGNFSTPSGGGGSLPTDYISGCQLVYNSTTQVNIGTGTVGLASGSIYTVSSVITLTPSLAASTMYYVYLTSSSTAVVSTTAPSTNYQGHAWHDGTTSHRYVGSFLTDGSSHIYKFQRIGNAVRYKVAASSTPFAVLASGSATTLTTVSCSGVVPPTCNRCIARVSNSGSGGVNITTSDGDLNEQVLSGNGAWVPADLNLTSQQLQYQNSGGAQTTNIRIVGYYEDL
jgi:hypothetical protein